MLKVFIVRNGSNTAINAVTTEHSLLLKPKNKRVDTAQSEIFSVRCIISLTFKAENMASVQPCLLEKAIPSDISLF